MSGTRRVLLKTPHEIAVIVAHDRISYGEFIEALGPDVLKLLKRAVFEAVRETVAEHSAPPPSPRGVRE